MKPRTIRLKFESLEAREVPANVIFTWEGDVDNLFSTAGNWVGNVAPTGDGVNNEILLFSSAASSFTPQDDIAGSHRFSFLEFTGTGYTLSGLGNNVTATNFLASNGASNTLDSSLALAGVTQFSVQTGTSLTINGTFDLLGASARANGTISDAVTGFTYDGQGSLTFNGTILNSGSNVDFTQQGGTVTFGGSTSNTYAGDTLVLIGTLKLNKTGSTAIAGNLILGNDVFPPNSAVVQFLGDSQIADSAAVTVNSEGKFDVNGFSELIGSLSGSGNVDMGAGILNVDLTGIATFSGIIGGPGNFQKSGAGVLTLTGTNTYTGPTGVNQGTLLVDGSIASASEVFVQLGTLGGIGAVGEIATRNGSHVAPGDSPGILKSGSVNFVAGSFLDVEIGGKLAGNGAGFHDRLNVTGTVTLATTGSGVTLNLSALGSPALAAGNNLLLIQNDDLDTVTGTFVAGTGFTVPAGTVLTEGKLVSTNFLGTGLRANITYIGGSGNDVVLKLTSPPLPPGPPVPPAPPAPGTPTDLFAVATGPGVPVQVKVFNADGSLRFNLQPFHNFSGGATVATGDVTGDGIDDIVVGAAANGHVKVFDGVTGAELRSFFAFDGFAGGVFVGVGDVTGDHRADIVVSAGVAASHVKVFDGTTGALVRSFLAFDGFAGGVSVRAGDINGDSIADIVVGAGAGAPPHIKIFDGTNLNVLASFLAGDPKSTSGVLVGAGNFVAGGLTEVVGSVNGVVNVFGFTKLGNSLLPYIEQENVIPFGKGISTAPAAIRLDNGIIAILVGVQIPGATPHVKILDGSSNTFQSFFAFDPAFTGGVNVG